VIHTNILTTGSSEHDGHSDVVTAPSYLDLERGPHSSVLFEQSSQFPGVLPYGILAGDSEKPTDHDSSLATLSVSGCTSCYDWTQGPTTQSTDSRGSSPETLVATIKYSELVPLQCGPLDADAVKTGVDLSSVPLSQEPECQTEPQDDPTPPSAIEGACDVNNVHEAFLSDDPEGDDDGETFDYNGVDWEPRASGAPTPSPTAETCVTPSPYSSPEPHFEHCRTPSNAEYESTSLSLSTSALREAALQSLTMYASDDIQVGVKRKNEAKVAYNTRRWTKCASAVAEEAIQTRKEPAVFPVPPTTVGPNSPRGLAASIHAPQVCQAIHSADAPNWAAAARADSTASSRGSPAQRGKTLDQGLGDGNNSDVPTATRCAVQLEDEDEGFDRDGVSGGSSEIDSGLDAADDSNEQESVTRTRRSRRRGKPRRPRTKVPYLPPPRMRNLTQHPIVDMIVEAQALHRLAAGSVVSNGQHYSLARQSQHPALVSDQLGKPFGCHQTPQQHTGSPSTAPPHSICSPQSHSSQAPTPYY
jgi:hypothetical protein